MQNIAAKPQVKYAFRHEDAAFRQSEPAIFARRISSRTRRIHAQDIQPNPPYSRAEFFYLYHTIITRFPFIDIVS